MNEKLYAIPVNDAFDAVCECPICRMYKTLEDDAIAYTMGPSYMEDDTRAQTDAKGFCTRHMEMIYANGNKLGIGLIMKTHLDKIIASTEGLSELGATKKGLFSKPNPEDASDLVKKLEEFNHSCFVCDRIHHFFERYIDTIFYLYTKDTTFAKKFQECRGFCLKHTQLLLTEAPKHLHGAEYEAWVTLVKNLFIENMKRMRDDVEWFTDKFDYRNQDAPWKNSKDAIPRGMTKIASILVEEP
ncbi:MAG: DUF6062 family protein [Lachnospiraceae bacterium]|nr:DUF6062 family protein [Lachnospiraceae bacterium]